VQIKLQVSNIEVTQIPAHPNKMMWTGVVTRLGVPSDAAPCGTNGKLLIISQEAAVSAIDTIVNMPLNCEFGGDFWGSSPEYAMTGHDQQFVIGAISSGTVEVDALVCSGIIWKQNFPDVAFMINNAVDALGFSIELDVLRSTEDDTTLTATEIVFTGASTLWKKCAAFESTEFRQLVASRIKNIKGSDIDMNEEQMKALLDAMFANVKVELSAVQASVEEKVNTVVASVDKANGEIATLAIAFAEAKESIKASAEPVVVVSAAAVAPVIPAPVVLAAGQVVVGNADLSVPADSFEVKLEAINAAKMAPFERLEAVTKLRLARENAAK
jgi:hypothetical protein